MAQSSNAMLRKGGLLGEFSDLLASVKHMFDGYHPERHYMRGPGTPSTQRLRKVGGVPGGTVPESGHNDL
jgi:hypothetical protein